MKRLLTNDGDLALMLVASESWVEWQDIVGRVLQRAPDEWRSAPENELKNLKQDIGALWNVFVKNYNASPGAIVDAAVVAEIVTEASRHMGLSFMMVPRYQWATHEMSCHLKYSVKKLLAEDRYHKATKKQLEQGESSRGLEAARGVLPARVVAKACMLSGVMCLADPTSVTLSLFIYLCLS